MNNGARTVFPAWRNIPPREKIDPRRVFLSPRPLLLSGTAIGAVLNYPDAALRCEPERYEQQANLAACISPGFGVSSLLPGHSQIGHLTERFCIHPPKQPRASRLPIDLCRGVLQLKLYIL